MSASSPRSPDPGSGDRESPRREAPEREISGLEDPPQTYEAAATRVEEIIRRLDSGDASLNETLELLREGKALIELCARELQAVAGALEELRLEELVERLEGEVSD
jgi:exodeoxyribonuclease VII small subunit